MIDGKMFEIAKRPMTLCFQLQNSDDLPLKGVDRVEVRYDDESIKMSSAEFWAALKEISKKAKA